LLGELVHDQVHELDLGSKRNDGAGRARRAYVRANQ